MKKTGKLLSIMIIAVLVVIMIVSNNTNAQGIVELSTTNSSVNVGDTFSINLAGEGMKLIDLNLIYDSSIFEYVGVNNSSITANPGENSLAVYYSGDGVDSVGLKFKAIKSTEGKSSSIAISKDSCKIKLPVADTEGAEKVDTELGYENLKGLEAVLETNVTVNKITSTYEEPALDKTSVNIVKGNQDTVTVTITNADKIGKYSWSSDNEEIASVNDGVITGNSVGETNVVLTSEGGNKTIAVKVTDSGEQPTPEPDNERPVLTPAESLKIKKGDKSTIKSDKAVEWTSGNENSVKIVSSDENSVNIEGIAVGKSIITATSKQNNELQNTIIVEVVDENSNNNNNGNQQGDNNQNNNNGNNNQGNNQNNGSNQNGNGSQTNNGSQNGNGNSGNRSNVQYSNTTTGGTQTRNSSSSANEVVPATGESSVETVAILVIVTLIVASIVFRKRSKIK